MVWKVLTNMYKNLPKDNKLWGCQHLTVQPSCWSQLFAVSSYGHSMKMRLLILECAIALLQPWGQAICTLASNLGQVTPHMEGYEHWYILLRFSKEVGVFQCESKGRFCQSSENNAKQIIACEVTYMHKNLPRQHRFRICHNQTVHSTKPLLPTVCSVKLWTQNENKAADIGMCYHPAIELQPWGQATCTMASNLGPEPTRKK